MDYLTQHYKNLSEQLQAKVNHLNTLIRLSEENYIPDPKKMEKFSKQTDEEKEKYNPKAYVSKKDKESTNKISEADKAKYAEAKEKSMKDAERKRQEEKPKPYTEKAPLKPIDVDTA